MNEKQNKQAIDKVVVQFSLPREDYNFLRVLNYRLDYARTKHPIFAKDMDDACDIIQSEFLEFLREVALENVDGARDEALDVIVTCLRFYNQEFNRRGG